VLQHIITAAKEVMYSPPSVRLFVCLSKGLRKELTNDSDETL